MTNYQLLEMDPVELVDWLESEYLIELPTDVNSLDEMNKAGMLLGKLANTYSYLKILSAYAKLNVRRAKQQKSNKEKIDEAVDRREIFETFADTIKLQYTAVSRMITVRKQMDEESKMDRQ